MSVKDNEDSDIGSKFETALKFFNRVVECRGKIFVHCTAGASRAPTIVTLFLMDYFNISLLDAYNYVRAKRTMVNPNKHFLHQLAEFEVIWYL